MAKERLEDKLREIVGRLQTPETGVQNRHFLLDSKGEWILYQPSPPESQSLDEARKSRIVRPDGTDTRILQTMLDPISWMPDGISIIGIDTAMVRKRLAIINFFDGSFNILYEGSKLNNYQLAISPNFCYLVFSEHDNPISGLTTLYMINLRDGSKKKLFGGSWANSPVRFSPDGMYIATTYIDPKDASKVGRTVYLVAYNTNTGELKKIAENTFDFAWVSNKEVVYDDKDYERIKKVNIDNLQSRILGLGKISSPMLSPDCQWIAFYGSEAVEVMKADGSQRKNVGFRNQGIISKGVISWAPDSKRFAYEYVTDPIDFIYTTNLTNDNKLLAEQASNPLWQPK